MEFLTPVARQRGRDWIAKFRKYGEMMLAERRKWEITRGKKGKKEKSAPAIRADRNYGAKCRVVIGAKQG